MYTKQQTFDLVISGLRKQNAREVGDKGTPVFRNKDGMCCAVGPLIDEKEYNPDFDDPKKLDEKSNAFKFVQKKGHDEDLLTSLMMCHDHKNPDEWESMFKVIAEKYNLEYKPQSN